MDNTRIAMKPQLGRGGEMKRCISIVALALVGAGAMLGLAGCGGAQTAGPATVTVTKTQKPTVTKPAETQPAETGQANSAGGGGIKVPDVVGKDHQLAQDTMQAAGLYNLSEEDATGQGRMLLWDRNWTVVSQDPPAGTMVSEDQTITLRSKKDGE